MLITYLNMPNMDGLELIKKVREEGKHRFTPIVMLTTESSEEKKKAGREAGASGWIVKPFKPEQLLKVVKMALDTDICTEVLEKSVQGIYAEVKAAPIPEKLKKNIYSDPRTPKTAWSALSRNYVPLRVFVD